MLQAAQQPSRGFLLEPLRASWSCAFGSAVAHKALSCVSTEAQYTPGSFQSHSVPLPLISFAHKPAHSSRTNSRTIRARTRAPLAHELAHHSRTNSRTNDGSALRENARDVKRAWGKFLCLRSPHLPLSPSSQPGGQLNPTPARRPPSCWPSDGPETASQQASHAEIQLVSSYQQQGN